NIFTIEYEDSDREKARDVVAAVLDTFVERAHVNEGDDADITERALASEIEGHEKRLSEAGSTLAQFKQTNLGYMPDEYGDYYKRLQGALSTVSATEEKIRLVSERREELKRQIQGEVPVFGIMGANTSACSQGPRLAQLETELEGLR